MSSAAGAFVAREMLIPSRFRKNLAGRKRDVPVPFHSFSAPPQDEGEGGRRLTFASDRYEKKTPGAQGQPGVFRRGKALCNPPPFGDGYTQRNTPSRRQETSRCSIRASEPQRISRATQWQPAGDCRANFAASDCVDLSSPLHGRPDQGPALRPLSPLPPSV